MSDATTRSAPHAFTAETPQYVFINRAPGSAWHQERLDTIGPELVSLVTDAIGVTSDASGRRRLGLSFILSYLDGPRDRLIRCARRLLDVSRRLRVPILLTLDGQNWWDGRPDLWNWWDASAPGYDPANVQNVEWTDPGPEHAVKVCWRNWGRQLRVRPAPNLMSPRVREAMRVELVALATPIRQWLHDLDAEERALCPGIKLGWEASIGINAYHYPNGNHFFEQWPHDASHDPTGGLDMKRDFAGGQMPLGYAALASEGVRPKDARVTLADHERIVNDYLGFLASTCRTIGFAPDELFLHSGGQFAPWPLHYSHRVPIVPDAVPGYSFYDVAPAAAGDLSASLDAARRDDWCAAEWLTHAKTADGWAHDLQQALSFRHCRHLTIYNWEGIAGLPHAIEGLRRVIASSPPD